MIGVFDVTHYVGRMSKFECIHGDVLIPVLEVQGLYPLGYIRAVYNCYENGYNQLS